MIGTIEVICGGMFAWKTKALHKRLRYDALAKKSVLLVTADGRYGGESRTHDEGPSDLRGVDVLWTKSPDFESYPYTSGARMAEYDVVGFDEFQFLPEPWCVELIETLRRWGLQVVVAGLDLDFRGEPFSAMAQALARADYVSKLAAVCVDCGGRATVSYRIIPSIDRVEEGGKDKYEALCRDCHMAKGGVLPGSPR